MCEVQLLSTKLKQKPTYRSFDIFKSSSFRAVAMPEWQAGVGCEFSEKYRKS